ncbi:hypothetical protein O1611_g75 [Lasiodiplodia mahajangana]|uniref:Uncharacterized protein n=1 Tax=Lasiodiplodia mahajangana TaxID=1108764 RepID=A0ACC2K1Z9_9PEZI|nr:hypothetical protein O1611_g75 [Lasiodiplodia mahajangana]
MYRLFLAPSFGMETTCGSYALKGLEATEDAAIATSLRDAGYIIIGLSNLSISEWANCRGDNLTAGWSAVGGQTQSPYVRGSSSGSAAGTAAGFSAFGMGSESDGSIVQPAVRAALYSIKGTDGIYIAYLNYKTWQFDDWVYDPLPEFDNEHEPAMISALELIETAGAKLNDLASYELGFCLERVLKSFPISTIHNLEDLIEFNKNNAELELPSGGMTNGKSAGTRLIRATEINLVNFRDAIEKCFNFTGANVIMESGESYLTTIALGSGYPIASVPLGLLSYKGRPHGMEILARNGEEAQVFKVMSAWEATFPDARKPPPKLVEWDRNSELRKA